jgi:hypothetical protein
VKPTAQAILADTAVTLFKIALVAPRLGVFTATQWVHATVAWPDVTAAGPAAAFPAAAPAAPLAIPTMASGTVAVSRKNFPRPIIPPRIMTKCLPADRKELRGNFARAMSILEAGRWTARRAELACAARRQNPYARQALRHGLEGSSARDLTEPTGVTPISMQVRID